MTDTSDKSIYFGGAIKALDGNRVGGYLIEYTDEHNKDLDGEFFTADTNQLEDDYPTKGLKVLFHHGLNKDLGVKVIGEIETVRNDKKGLWVEAILKEHEDYKAYLEDIKTLVNKGVLSWSSGALPQSVAVDKNGFIKSWAKIEGSLTHTPANPSGTKIHSLKSIASTHLPKEADTPKEDIGNDIADLSNTPIESVSSEGTRTMSEVIKSLSSEDLDELASQVMSRIKSESDLEQETLDNIETEIKAEVADVKADDTEDIIGKAFSKVLTALPEIIEKVIDKKAKQTREFDDGVSKALSQVKGKSKVGSGTHGQSNPHISVSEDLKYAHLTAEELQANYMLFKAFSPLSKVPGRKTMGMFHADETFLKHLAHKSVKAEEKFATYEDQLAVKSAKPFKADEINASNIAGQGDEWVGIHYSTSLWEKARNQRIHQALLSKGMMEVEVPQGHESTYVLTEGADPTVFTRTQANDLDTNGSTTRIKNNVVPQGIGTGRVLLTPGELVTMVGVTQQATEDSLIPFLSQTNRQLQETMLETLDKLNINADSATGSNTNINLIDGTPSSTITSVPYYIASNGFLKYALVTGSGTSRDGGTLNENDYRLTYQLMPSAIRENRERLLFIVDSDTHDASLDIAAIKTDDVRRSHATLTSGLVTNIYGIDVARTGFMGLANTAGKVSGTPSSNTLGRILCVYAPYWAIGWKRHISFDYDYDIYSATNLIAVSMRVGHVARGAGASTVSYNLTV